MNYENILVEKGDWIATVTLNRPDRINALNRDMTNELATALRDIDADDSMRVMVITGAGRGFCSGADTGSKPREAGRTAERGEQGAEATRQGLRRGLQQIIRGIRNMDKPTIAMVNGVCVGAGFDIACACDLRMGSENARFMVAFVRIGLFPGTGGTWLMPRVMGVPKAAELLFTGDYLEAADAEKYGVLNRLVPADKLREETMALARKIANGPPIAIRLAKLQLYRGLNMDLETALEVAAASETITIGSEDHQEGVAAFRERRAPVFKGR